MALRFSEITRQHLRRDFDCGAVALNTFIQQFARQQTEREISRTYVLTDDENPVVVLGFVTIVFGEIKSPPGKVQSNYPHPLTCLLIARLGVDIRFQGQGLGEQLIIEAIKSAVVAHGTAPLLGLFVDSKDERSDGFYLKMGFLPLHQQAPDQAASRARNSLWLPIGTCQQVVGGLPSPT